MRCGKCAAELPADGKFCIECGAPVSQAATGATERLPDYAGGPQCAACGTRNPPGAAFCVTCGRGLVGRPAADARFEVQGVIFSGRPARYRLFAEGSQAN